MNLLHLLTVLELTDDWIPPRVAPCGIPPEQCTDHHCRLCFHCREEERPISLFTDIFSIPNGLTEEQERVIEVYDSLPLDRCRMYTSELQNDGTPPLARLEHEEGESAWCVSCTFRWFCKMKRKIGRHLRRHKEFLKESWWFFIILYGVMAIFIGLAIYSH